MSASVRRKWRPSLWAVVLLVLGIVLLLPFAGLILFRFYANQLVQQTEESLLTQASVLSAIYAELYQEGAAAPAETVTAPARSVSGRFSPRTYQPVYPDISIGRATILPPRADPEPVEGEALPIYQEIGPQLSRIAEAAQEQTLAGYRMLDPEGRVIAGSAELDQSLAHVEEVARALAGETVSVARVRLREGPEPFLYHLSRGTRVRVFVALPVTVGGDVIGAVYISRTPNHIFRFLYGERLNLAQAALFILLSTGLIGYVFWRFITRPIRGLIQRTDAVGHGAERWQPPEHFGTREIEALSDSFQSLTERLGRQQDGLRTYTAHVSHELKSPLTSVKGAAELLRTEDMSQEQRTRFLDNIERDTSRMEDLLSSMRAFSLAEQAARSGETELATVVGQLSETFDAIMIIAPPPGVTLPLRQETLLIVLTHLIENAKEHGATQVALELSEDGGQLSLQDNGRGISDGNRDKIFAPFFTTRRESGGTGMGLNIVKAMIETVGGEIALGHSEAGARFEISLPG